MCELESKQVREIQGLRCSEERQFPENDLVHVRTCTPKTSQVKAVHTLSGRSEVHGMLVKQLQELDNQK